MIVTKNRYLVFLISIMFILAALMTGCTSSKIDGSDIGEVKEEAKELTIYSGRQEKFALPFVEKFEKETGIKVNLISGKATEYAHRIVEEKENTQADVFWANDAGILEYLRLENMLTPIESDVLEQISSNYQGKDRTWTALTIRHRVFLYNTDQMTYENMPKSIFDLVDPKYKGQFAMDRAGNESMVSYFTSLRAIIGPEKTLELLKGIMANEPLILQSHTDVRRAVGSGEVKFGLVNNYHYKIQLTEEGLNHIAQIFPDQGKDEIGTFVNISGVAITKHAKHPKNALLFVEFLLKAEQQKMNDETPIINNLEGVEYETAKIANTSLSEIGPLWEETTELMEKAGYSD
ncbi:iron uptake protein A1 precursor [Clostridium homopropionicum DSM 5847]|uniref:Iron uptake protein A1 n=1 Tax=Clostridium homopropionicum DSM 5847 TaxID=1121318 RepID=A0A0L6ZCM8_9CLOT|nr:extracellular solute-binding protein [Clostridium homopropionicum]KOA20729.1 iron uptake protein A1 precursor [Clostridium homopropionicum DSM 5847]SFF90518.1 iron(III) transport system substrate-binding protein [Clostridium homopropionicum]